MSDHVIGLVGLGVAGISAVVGVVAVIYAHVAVKRASDAKEFAKTANEIAGRGEAREIEKHDVHWDGEWDPGQPGRYLLRKRGDDEARNVRARVSYGDDEQTVVEASMTGDGETLVFVFEEALTDYQEEYEYREERLAVAAASPFPEVTGGWVPPRMHRVHERVEWETPLGMPKLHEDSPLLTFSLYFDR
ncbi:hypothetical protein ACTXG5_22825 [Mycobacterium sp. Dal123C01]|uniref:hypothetical protein n=1 Tax=Mycobacterium sp. Dal123C01 TaxID=3457577 RepID=UPI00403EE7FE